MLAQPQPATPHPRGPCCCCHHLLLLAAVIAWHRHGDASLARVPEGQPDQHEPGGQHICVDARPRTQVRGSDAARALTRVRPQQAGTACSTRQRAWPACVCHTVLHTPSLILAPSLTPFRAPRAKLDSNPALTDFCTALEAAVIETIEAGHMTKDLAICVHGTTKVRGRPPAGCGRCWLLAQRRCRCSAALQRAACAPNTASPAARSLR